MDGRSGRIPELPSSAVNEILRRLPLKTLVNCSLVCKSWKAMLSEIYFYKLYSTHTPTTLMIGIKGDNIECLRRIYIVEPSAESSAPHGVYITHELNNDISNENNGDDNGVRGAVEEAKGEGQQQHQQEEGYHLNCKYQLGNSCNGLICLRELRSREPIAIWNPIMGQYVSVPKPVSTSDEKVVAGFGFSPRSNTYKVLRILHEKETPAAKWVAEIYDFGLSSSMWRRIGDAPCLIPSRIPGFFINSSVHWILDYTISSGPNQLICSFDFNNEGFRFVPPPPIFSLSEKTNYHWSNLGVLAGCFSICAIDSKNFRADVEVWVMNEYGDPESWVKKLSIKDPAVDWWDPYRWIQVTNFLKTGEILLLCGHRYVLAYDPKARAYIARLGLTFPAIAHVPSFVSLKRAFREDAPAVMDVKTL